MAAVLVVGKQRRPPPPSCAPWRTCSWPCQSATTKSARHKGRCPPPTSPDRAPQRSPGPAGICAPIIGAAARRGLGSASAALVVVAAGERLRGEGACWRREPTRSLRCMLASVRRHSPLARRRAARAAAPSRCMTDTARLVSRGRRAARRAETQRIGSVGWRALFSKQRRTGGVGVALGSGSSARRDAMQAVGRVLCECECSWGWIVSATRGGAPVRPVSSHRSAGTTSRSPLQNQQPSALSAHVILRAQSFPCK